MRALMGVVAAVTLAGCESVYSPPTSGPVAQVEVSRAKMLDTQQAKLLHLGVDRSRRDSIGEGIYYEYDKPWPVAAEARTVFEVEAVTYRGNTDRYCSTFYSFVPKAGHSYVFTPVNPEWECVVEITDKQTGGTPPDLRQELASAG